jgi:hypothetical protein
MKRIVWMVVPATLGLLLAGWALLVPSHWRAVDAAVIRAAGNGTPSLTAAGLQLVSERKIGPAQLFLQAAEGERPEARARLDQAIQAASLAPLTPWGGPAPQLDRIFVWKQRPTETRPFLEFLIAREARETVLSALHAVPRATVKEILQTRSLTNLVHCAPVTSAAGQPYDAAVLITALLYTHDGLTADLRNEVDSLVYGALRRGEVEKLELFYLDMVSLAKRFNWAQLTELLRSAPSAATIRDLANLLRRQETDGAAVYAAALWSGPAEVARYLISHANRGVADLKFSLSAGQGAVRALVQEQQPIYYAKWRDRLTAWDPFGALFGPWLKAVERSAALGIGIKYGLILLGAWLLALAGTCALEGSPRSWQQTLGGTPCAIAGAILLLSLIVSEPYLFEHRQNVEFALHWKIPTVKGPIRDAVEAKVKPMVDKLSLVSLLLFMAIQVTIYCCCRRKLAEIQRGNAPSKLKLKLLENEEHLFDAGLYVGFVGTVLSLVCVSLGIIKPSLMAAYSSTSFGIIFVSILKIFHLRPYRKQLILETESEVEATAQAA